LHYPIPEHLIETILNLSRTSRQMLQEIGRELSPEELAEKLAMPLEKVRKVLLAKQPIRLKAPIFDKGAPTAADLANERIMQFHRHDPSSLSRAATWRMR
jgi:RNA polymerase primary sigma factor